MNKTSANLPLNWKTELNATSMKYHIIISWVAVILNPIWAIGVPSMAMCLLLQ